MASSVLLAELDRTEAGRRAAAGAVLVLPAGATEQHGPHLPAGTDTLNVEHIARTAAEQLAARAGATVPVVVAPALPFGSSDHHLPFGATLSLDSEVLLRALRSLGRSAVASGFERLFLLNGHGGNQEIVRLAGRDLSRDLGVHVASGAWWELARDEIEVAGGSALGRVPGHAGAFETSAVLALRPELVGEPTSRPAPPTSGPPLPTSALRIERPGMWTSIDGFSDDPSRARAEVGARCLEAAAGVVALAIEQLYEAAGGSLDPARADRSVPRSRTGSSVT